MPALVLLGDSILDNEPYVAPRPDTAEHLRRLLGADWTVELLARDGSTMADVPAQLGRLPEPTDCAVLSVGGNDALEHIDLLSRPASSVAEVLAELGRIAETFAGEYDRLLAMLVPRVRRAILCTIYEPPLHEPNAARLARVPLSLLNDRIVRCAASRALEVIDLRAVCTETEDFVLQIEPSPAGAEKIARAIARVVRGEPGARAARVYGA
ncbi:MAG TPA: SGNH/GDSL hydrolase family protein [Thermodesulfobacteriota bacterium]